MKMHTLAFAIILVTGMVTAGYSAEKPAPKPAEGTVVASTARTVPPATTGSTSITSRSNWSKIKDLFL